MTNKLTVDPVQNKYPYTYESTADNDNAYLHEEFEETLDQFDDNDF